MKVLVDNWPSIIISSIVTFLTVVTSVFALSDRFVTSKEFAVFKLDTIGAVSHRLDRIENKLDRLLEKQKGQE